MIWMRLHSLPARRVMAALFLVGAAAAIFVLFASRNRVSHLDRILSRVSITPRSEATDSASRLGSRDVFGVWWYESQGLPDGEGGALYWVESFGGNKWVLVRAPGGKFLCEAEGFHLIFWAPGSVAVGDIVERHEGIPILNRLAVLARFPSIYGWERHHLCEIDWRQGKSKFLCTQPELAWSQIGCVRDVPEARTRGNKQVELVFKGPDWFDATGIALKNLETGETRTVYEENEPDWAPTGPVFVDDDTVFFETRNILFKLTLSTGQTEAI